MECADAADRRPRVEGKVMVSRSALLATYWVIARGGGATRRARPTGSSRSWAGGATVLAATSPRSKDGRRRLCLCISAANDDAGKLILILPSDRIELTLFRLLLLPSSKSLSTSLLISSRSSCHTS